MLGTAGVIAIEDSIAALLPLLLLLSKPARMAPMPRAPTAAVATTAVVLLKNELERPLEGPSVGMSKIKAKQGVVVQIRVMDNIIARMLTKNLGDLVW